MASADLAAACCSSRTFRLQYVVDFSRIVLFFTVHGPSVKLEEFKLNEQTELLREMCHLLRVIAEPQLAKRDERLRASLLEAVGKRKASAKAAHLMDGTRNQTAICKESGIDPGDLSRLTKDLRSKGLIAPEEKNPKLIITIPPTFFDSSKK